MNVYQFRIAVENGEPEVQHVAAKTIAVALATLTVMDQFAAEKVISAALLCTLDHICPTGDAA